jgi:4-hydroxybenzoate polyprenyltransferase
MTAVADVLAGYAVAELANPRALPWLISSSACLYAGGVVLNDVFDRRIDAIERPERAIPSGRVSTPRAAALGTALLAGGVAAAAAANGAAGRLALTIAALVVAYDAWGKRSAVGPVNMGLCRALNLMLGMAAVPAVLAGRWALAAIPFLYITAVTALSRGEVHGGTRGTAGGALVSLIVVLIALVALGLTARAWPAVLIALAFGWRVVPAFWKAFRTPDAGAVRSAVRTGVLSLVLVDAAIAAAYAGAVYAAIVLATGLAAGLLARLFAVT